MRRRWAGVLVVVVALAALVMAAHVSPGLVSGVAAPTPVLSAPNVGDCVLEPFAGGPGWSDPGGTYPPLRTGICGGLRYGEVVAVVPHGLTEYATAKQHAADPSTGAPNANPLLDICITKVAAYVGMVQRPGSMPALFKSWYPPGVPEATVIGPSARQQAAGQTWLACSYRFPTTQPASASLKGEYTTGTVPGRFARCRTSTDPTYPTYAPVACNLAHPVEEFGVELQSETAAQRNRSCGQLVRRLTGMADPTVGGRLRIRVLVTPRIENAADPIYCVLATTTPHLLHGPLLGLGSAAVPWSN